MAKKRGFRTGADLSDAEKSAFLEKAGMAGKAKNDGMQSSSPPADEDCDIPPGEYTAALWVKVIVSDCEDADKNGSVRIIFEAVGQEPALGVVNAALDALDIRIDMIQALSLEPKLAGRKKRA